jgi:urea carboxylase-associated protein 2
MTESQLILEEPLRGGQMWSRVLRRGQRLRLTDVEGGASVAALFYNADDPSERYNMPDTLKAQHIARLTAGFVLYSDMGRVLCSITEDTAGWHDTITGHGTAAHGLAKFGAGSYQKLRNDWHRNTRDNFLVELGKYDLGKRDIVANVNFFVKVVVDEQGALHFVPDSSKPGGFVELRAELDTLVVLSHELRAQTRRAHDSHGRARVADGSLPAIATRKRARFHAHRELFRGEGLSHGITREQARSGPRRLRSRRAGR